MCLKAANNEDSDQNALRESLIRVYMTCTFLIFSECCKLHRSGTDSLSGKCDPGLCGFHIPDFLVCFILEIGYLFVHYFFHFYVQAMLQATKIRTREPFDEIWSGST